MTDPVLLVTACLAIALCVAAAGLVLLVRKLASQDVAALTARCAVAESEAARAKDLATENTALRAEKGALERTAAETAEALRNAKSDLEETQARHSAALEKLEKQLVEDRTRIDALNRENRGQAETLARTQTDLKQEQEARAQAESELKKQFQALSRELLDDQGARLSKLHKEQLDGLLQPLRDNIKTFRDRLETTHTESAKQHAALSSELKRISQDSARLSEEAHNLTKALKGQVQMQGAWGEMILETVLQRSGLREGIEYHVQTSQTQADGRRLRPDVIVSLPQNERLVIDSKVSLKGFEAYVNAGDDAARAAALAGHASSVRTHIKRLNDKDYHANFSEKIDYVLMFVPLDAAWLAALEHDKDLIGLSVDSQVAVVTPTTLITVLKTVAGLWKVERQNQNARAIADRAGELYNKFNGFANDMRAIGDKLDGAQGAYTNAFKKLTEGRGNLVRQVEMLKELGAETTKSLPTDLLEAAGAEDKTTSLNGGKPDDGDRRPSPSTDSG